MKKKILFPIIIVLILIVIVRLTTPTKNTGPKRIEDVIWRMFSTAKSGEIQPYLNCFTGNSLATLQADQKQNKDGVFRNYIRQDAQDIKGVSIINGRQEDPQRAVFEVEVVYSDRNEKQTFYLQRAQSESLGGASDEWKISQISRPVIEKQPIAYLSMVVEE